jgi:hypothetical protein
MRSQVREAPPSLRYTCPSCLEEASPAAASALLLISDSVLSRTCPSTCTRSAGRLQLFTAFSSCIKCLYAKSAGRELRVFRSPSPIDPHSGRTCRPLARRLAEGAIQQLSDRILIYFPLACFISWADSARRHSRPRCTVALFAHSSSHHSTHVQCPLLKAMPPRHHQPTTCPVAPSSTALFVCLKFLLTLV